MDYIRNSRLGTFLFIFIVGAIANMVVFRLVMNSDMPIKYILLVASGCALVFTILKKS